MFPNIRVSGQHDFPLSECDVRVNYLDTSKVLAGANANIASGGTGQAQFWSIDGGFTWSGTNLPLNSGDDFHSDPTVDWTSDGTAWALTIAFDSAQTHLRVRAFKSTDGGATWSYDADVSGAQTNADKEMMWVDRSASSTHRDNIYAIWHNGGAAFVNRRTGPSGSWQTPVQVSGAETTGTGIGGDIKTNSAGDVFAFWPDTGSQGLFVAKSTDGGATYSAPVLIATTLGSFQIAMPADSNRQALIYISGAARRDATRDNVYAVWMDLAGGAGCSTPGDAPGSSVTSACKTRIWFSRSTNGSAAWSAPQMLNNQSTRNDQFFPRIALDEATGQLSVSYYDTVADAGRLQTDIWMQTSDDDGVTWGSAFKITSARTDETVDGADNGSGSGNVFGDQYGDYTGLSGHAGTFLPLWTDRRNGAREEIWTAPVRTTRDCFFLIQRSTFGQDEVSALLGTPPSPAFVSEAFWVVVEGFTARDLGLTTANLGAPPLQPTITITPAVSGMLVHCTGVVPEDPSLPPILQRFRFSYEIVWTSADGFGFAGDRETVTLSAALSAVGTAVQGSGQILLIKQANPYITNGPTSWLSIDLRVFQVSAGQGKFNSTLPASPVGADASQFIHDVTRALTDGQGSAGGQSYEADLSIDEDQSAVSLTPTDPNGKTVFNFAIARVRLRGLTVSAHAVRIFFRLFQAQSTATSFDSTTSYRRWSDGTTGGQSIALAGIQNGEYVTVPCFAAQRVDSSTVGMQTQLDPDNVQDITVDPTGAEVDTYFGCWLDINQAQGILPATPPAGSVDGPFAGSLLSLREVITRSPHQCLVAEIAFDPVAIPAGADPSISDKLAQRNLAFGPAPNPGIDPSRRVPQTFEVRATSPSIVAATARLDELMIDWGTVPLGSTAEIYLPEVDASTVLQAANRMYATHSLSLLDGHTLQCPTASVTYLPVLPDAARNYAGLFTVNLPTGIRKGQRFSYVVRQVTSAFGRISPPPPPSIGIARRALRTQTGRGSAERQWRRVDGTFQVILPISTKEQLLLPEERLLSVLRWIQLAIPISSRWYRVFQRYVSQVAGRVSGLGGNPGQITPSPDGSGIPGHGGHHHGPRPDERKRASIGKVVGLIFDRFGDFEGFHLETEECERTFYSREREILVIVERAWRERLRIAVWYEADDPDRPARIVVLRPPAAWKSE